MAQLKACIARHPQIRLHLPLNLRDAASWFRRPAWPLRGAAIGASLPLSEPPAVTARSCDAELIDLGARFEPLLDQYYVAHRRCSGALAKAQTEHDQEFRHACGRGDFRKRKLDGSVVLRQ
jgi:hypothetical protein